MSLVGSVGGSSSGAIALQITRVLQPQNTLISTTSMAILTAADGPASVPRRHNNTNGGFGCLGAVGMAAYASVDGINIKALILTLYRIY